MGASGFLREFVRIATKIREANDLVTLIVVTQDHRAWAKLAPCGGNPGIHGVVREYKVIIERATGAALFLRSNRNRHFCPPSVPQLKFVGNGDVESIHRLQRIHCAVWRPTRGVVEARSLTSIDDSQEQRDAQNASTS